MAPKLRKCNIVHIHVIDKLLQGLTLPLVTYNFGDESEVIDQNNNLFEPSLTTNVERAGKTNTTYVSQTPIELPSKRKQLIRRSLFTSRQNRDVSTPTNGRDGLKQPSCPKSSVEQNPSEQHIVDALEGTSQDEANAAKKNVSVLLEAQKQNDRDGVTAQEGNDTRNSQKDDDTTNAQKENVLVLVLKEEKESEALFQDQEEGTSELTNRVVNIEQLEASHQKKIADMEASHQRDIGELSRKSSFLRMSFFHKNTAQQHHLQLLNIKYKCLTTCLCFFR
ncbi:hypothetical protein Cgig2_021858 [Carnegiea gigantea]|uniref:Uncharacterized protein n=1 Tax=Carnegiea gigantea TaxID=171969 RepID=A0A9Q1K4F9_9CARY|nr:hypothetical protein Cgig2_021858 [Carnegiea gigantea]